MALTTTEVAEFARRAHELLNDGGSHWTKGSYVLSGRFCLIGAVRQSIFGEADGYKVNESDPRFISIVLALANAVRALYPSRVTDHDNTSIVINFNDHDETTWEDVEAVLQYAEAELERS